MAYNDTWARQIVSDEQYVAIPDDLRRIYERDAGAGFASSSMLIYCPRTDRWRSYLSEKLIYLREKSLYYIERADQGLIRRVFDAKNIYALEAGHILLDSWITIAGRDGDQSDMVIIYFNRTVYKAFERIITMLRAYALGLDFPAPFDNRLSTVLEKKNFKYMNYARDLIFQAENPIACYVYQKAISKKAFKIFNVSLTNDHVALLSKDEVIHLSEGRKMIERYGIVKTFYIRRHMDRSEYSEDEESGNLQITLSAGLFKRVLYFDPVNKRDAIALIKRI